MDMVKEYIEKYGEAYINISLEDALKVLKYKYYSELSDIPLEETASLLQHYKSWIYSINALLNASVGGYWEYLAPKWFQNWKYGRDDF
jgi:hypothetical protein